MGFQACFRLYLLDWPRITLVTPSFNQAAWLERTLVSIISQNYPNLEYGVVDGGSTDGTSAVLDRYRDRLAFCVSEPDNGMYDAIQKGFARSTGSIMGWLNSDDLLMPGALLTLARLFTDLPQVEWLTGCRCAVDEQDCTVALEPARAWSAAAYALDHRWIQQESTFWKKGLWDRAGASLNTELKLAGDFELWHRFFGFAELYSTDALLGGFRVRRSGQASLEQLDRYEEEAAAVRLNCLLATEVAQRVASIRKRERVIASLKGVGKDGLRARFITPLVKTPPRIQFDRLAQKFVLPPL